MRITGYGDCRKAAHGSRRRVGAVRRIRHEYPGAPGITAIEVVRAHHQHPSQLTLSTGTRLQRCSPEACNRGEQLLQLEHDPQRTLDGLVGLERMDVCDAAQPCDVLVDLRVVLHGAGPERVEDGVDREIPLSQMGEVAHHVELADLGQPQARAYDLAREIINVGYG